MMFIMPARRLSIKWLDIEITFGPSNVPDICPYPRKFPIVVSTLIKYSRVNRVLMDGGSSLSIIYLKTLNALQVPWGMIQPSQKPFYGIVSDMKA